METYSTTVVYTLCGVVAVLASSLAALGGLYVREIRARARDNRDQQVAQLRADLADSLRRCALLEDQLRECAQGRLQDLQKHHQQLSDLVQESANTVFRVTASLETLTAVLRTDVNRERGN